MDVRQINIITLAYLGDAIYEVYVRKYLIDQGIVKVKELQAAAVKYVSASSQTKYLKEIEIEPEYIIAEIEKRNQAKKNKDYELADKIRSDLDEKGIILNDTVEGTTWDIKSLYQI